MADILLREEDLKFASTMVHTLNTILLTSTELFQLRNQLKDLRTLVLPSDPSVKDPAHSPAGPRRRWVNWESSLPRARSTCSSPFLPTIHCPFRNRLCWFWDALLSQVPFSW